MRAIILAVAAPLLMVLHPAAAKNAIRLENMEYLKARKIILGYGWAPVAGSCQGPDVDHHTCATYPEIDNCSGVGIGYCDMAFRRGRQCLYLITIGGAPQDEPGDTEVRDVRFSRNGCAQGSRR